MRLGDTEVEILISGQPAKEYTDDDFEQEPLEDEASKYIEAVEGSNFAFRCTLHPSYKFAPAIDYLCFTFSVDGEQVTGKVVTPEEISQGRTASKMRGGGYTGVRAGRVEEQRFRFGKIETYDHTVTKAESERLKEEFREVGELRCQVWRKVGAVADRPRSGCDMAKDLPNIHEKAVAQRAVSLGTRRDAVTSSKSASVWSGKTVDEEPIAAFTFKYRDKASLQKLGVIEYTPPPTPLEERDFSTLTAEQLREVAKILKAKAEEQQVKIKKEKRDATLKQMEAYKRGKEESDSDSDVTETEHPHKKARIEIVELDDD